MARIQNALRNTKYGLLGKIVNLCLGFVTRTIFIYILGSTYLGVNGLYSEILGLLSFAELGFGSAMTFKLYKPVAEGDREKTIELLSFYKRVYQIIAAVIAFLGLCLLPCLPSIVKGADWLTVRQLRSYFLIFLFNTVVGYFVTYKYSYLNALQKNYIQTNIETITSSVSSLAQILVIMLTRNFLLYLLINSAVLTISRFIISRYLNHRYPLLSETPEKQLGQGERSDIFKEVRGLVVHQFSSVAVHSTDNILISMLSGLGVVAVGYVSNYNMLMTSVLGFVTIVFGSVTSGLGNMAAIEIPQRFCQVFKQINFAAFWVYGFCAIAFWILIPPFITLWIGADKLIDQISFTLIALNSYLVGLSSVYHNARIAKGNFGLDKKWAFIQAVVNLVVSVIAAKFLGLVGIFIGTIVSRLVYMLFRPRSTYSFLFEESSRVYYRTILLYSLWVFIAATLTRLLTGFILCEVTLIRFILSALIVCVIPNLVFLLCTFRSVEFYEWKSKIGSYCSHFFNKRSKE